MARIRTIKPDFFRHEALFEAERASKLPLRISFAGLWTAADREGRFVWRPRVLKLDILPFDDVDFVKVLDALVEHGFVIKYEAGADTFGCIPSWSKHQHVNQREAESVIPAHDSEGARTCMHMQESGEGKGREGKGREQEGEGKEISVELKLDGGPVTRVFEHWRSEYRHPKASLDPKRRKAIQRALESYDEPTVCAAISGYRLSPHHMGQNDQRSVYDDISLFLRDAEHIERGLNFARAPPARVQSAVEVAREKLRGTVNGHGRVVSDQPGGSSESGVGSAIGLVR